MSAESTEDKFATLPVSNIYTEICTGIRETDDASFRLLSLVPLVSGTALITVVFQNGLRPEVELLLSLFAAGITFGLFRWELRNIQTCSWLMRFAEAVESAALHSHPQAEKFCKRPDAPHRIGKTEAEKLIYTVTILAWLALPLAVRAVPHLPCGAAATYYTVAGIILCLTAISLSEDVHVQPFLTKEAAAQSVKAGNS